MRDVKKTVVKYATWKKEGCHHKTVSPLRMIRLFEKCSSSRAVFKVEEEGGRVEAQEALGLWN